ncbi:MAG: hypothetical protein HC819_12615 [Cyclobacteriaceae bacterium]|nr:hypothetical protein [Cyclobacteriaceae bacterium]
MLIGLVCIANLELIAQFNNSYTVSDNQEFDKIKFSLNATNGQCFIEAGDESGILNIHSNSPTEAQPLFKEDISNRTKEVKVKLNEDQNSLLSSSISKRLFSSQAVEEYTWKVYLSKLKPMDLDLTYAIGDTYIDLSDLPIERLKMRTGTANVRVNYKNGLGNRLAMDTFMIKVDMGTMTAKNLHLSNAKNIIANVGFGKVKMDFEDAKILGTEVMATVGAGSLEVLLPGGSIPVRINVNDSPLCRVKIPEGFVKSSDNVFLSANYTNGQVNYINFSVDVAVGNVIFKDSNQ